MQSTTLASVSASFYQYAQNFVKNAPYRTAKNGQMGLQQNTLRNYHNFLTVWSKFEANKQMTIDLLELNQEVILLFKDWLFNDCGYSPNNIGRLVSILKTICLDAQKNDIKTHPYVNHIKNFSQPKQERIIHVLSFEEIKKIEQCCIPDTLENTRKWVLIGCWVGQRVSDLLSLEPKQVRPSKKNGFYVDFYQQKTRKKVTVGVINPEAIRILTKDFPTKMSSERFNKQLKLVLREAGLTQMVLAERYNGKTKRKERGLFPKYAIIASHDLRRSFATNFYGKIPTPILMNMTGHARESSFLTYIGMDEKRDSFADAFMDGVARLEL